MMSCNQAGGLTTNMQPGNGRRAGCRIRSSAPELGVRGSSWYPAAKPGTGGICIRRDLQHPPLDTGERLLAVHVDRAAIVGAGRRHVEHHVEPAALIVGRVAVMAGELTDQDAVVGESHGTMRSSRKGNVNGGKFFSG